MKKKIHFTIDKTAKLNATKSNLLKRYKNYSPNKADVIVVVGGDGFMLQVLKKYQKYNKPFYGMNKGTFGFLMIRRPPRSTLSSSSAASDVYKRQTQRT